MNRKGTFGTVMMLAVLLAAGQLLPGEGQARGGKYRIGERGPTGGWVFYDKGNSSGGWRYLEAAPADVDVVTWGCAQRFISGAESTAVGAGKKNTMIIARGCEETGSAAKLCLAYRGGGKSDWFLPSKDELNAMYVKLHRASIGGFENSFYWSSSGKGLHVTWFQNFGDGSQTKGSELSSAGVRPVRAF